MVFPSPKALSTPLIYYICLYLFIFLYGSLFRVFHECHLETAGNHRFCPFARFTLQLFKLACAARGAFGTSQDPALTWGTHHNERSALDAGAPRICFTVHKSDCYYCISDRPNHFLRDSAEDLPQADWESLVACGLYVHLLRLCLSACGSCIGDAHVELDRAVRSETSRQSYTSHSPGTEMRAAGAFCFPVERRVASSHSRACRLLDK